ncbi:hypothetical protein U9M48_043341 [Paspalum notatum var. saurae]|uniref:Uncharacterized protein n=1 Tax=Paspalum notatum var. saurae TaxID=547442 RepID=A0AAQ3UTA5_PASNO
MWLDGEQFVGEEEQQFEGVEHPQDQFETQPLLSSRRLRGVCSGLQRVLGVPVHQSTSLWQLVCLRLRFHYDSGLKTCRLSLFALRINVCEQQQEYLCGRQV